MCKFYCPICGNELDEPFSIGDICPCCGNESDCDDNMLKLTVDLDINLKNDLPIKIINKVSHLKQTDVIPLEIAIELLRYIWVRKECKWRYDDKPDNWGIEMAKEQLLNIGVNLEKYKKGVH